MHTLEFRMARLARKLFRFPLFRSIFGRRRGGASRLIPNDAPTILPCGPSLTGVDLLRSFGSGDARSYAVNNVSLELRRAELNLLMGPSGSGKSTLLAVISALLRPDSGKVHALGEDLWKMNEQELEQFRLRHCSYVFQGYNLFPALTARQQLEVVLKWGEGVNGREARRRSARVLGQLGMGAKMNLRPQEMSGGEKQRVAIGRALVKNPSFLFADEPTSALDWENGQQVIELLNGVARDRGATVLVVTHDPRLLPFANRVFEMADGMLQVENAHGHHGHHPVNAPTPMPPSRPVLFHPPASPKNLKGPRLHLEDPAYARRAV
jgi:putative ABC transport system ATP-binding protein